MTVLMTRRSCWSAAVAVVLLIGSLVLPTVSHAAAADALIDATSPLESGPLAGPNVAPPTAAEIASAHVLLPDSNRKVKVKTKDRAPGGLLEADISWSGKGPYSGKIYGTVQDLESDGYCVGAWVWNGSDLHPSISRHDACPSGDAESVYYSYKKKWRVLVDVCLVKSNRLYYCSDWK
jgi:hypothetical protein